MNVKQGIMVNIKTMNYMPAKKVSIYHFSLHFALLFFQNHLNHALSNHWKPNEKEN